MTAEHLTPDRLAAELTAQGLFAGVDARPSPLTAHRPSGVR